MAGQHAVVPAGDLNIAVDKFAAALAQATDMQGLRILVHPDLEKLRHALISGAGALLGMTLMPSDTVQIAGDRQWPPTEARNPHRDGGVLTTRHRRRGRGMTHVGGLEDCGLTPETFAGGPLVSFAEPPARIPAPSCNVPITAAQFAAGDRAFLRERRSLDDLFEHFECDRHAFIRAIYRAMVRAGGV